MGTFGLLFLLFLPLLDFFGGGSMLVGLMGKRKYADRPRTQKQGSFYAPTASRRTYDW